MLAIAESLSQKRGTGNQSGLELARLKKHNPVENAIRPVALGHKNYLFAGSHDGARRAALIYSLVGTAQLNQLEPFAYLRDVIACISEHPHKQLSELLPQNCKRTVSTHSQS